MIEPQEIIVKLYQKQVGKIALTPQGVAAFQYDLAYENQGFSISPLKLPLSSEVYVAPATPFRGNFGVFDDSLPDGWGRLLQDRDLRQRGVDPFSLTTLQRLAIVGKDGRGALEYEPVEKAIVAKAIENYSLDEISKSSEKILDDQEIPVAEWKNLIKAGGSSGGARPKVFVKAEGKEWLVKFASQLDSKDVGETEYHYAELAKLCQIEMPETRLFDNQYFGTCRFDRIYERDGKVRKVHVVSAAGILHADYRIPSLDYEDLLWLTKILTRDNSQVLQFFRRMVFNVLIKNQDDHAKNFAFMVDESGEWKLTPAYDLLPSQGFNGFHTTTINGNGRPTKDDCFIVGKKVGLKEEEMRNCYREIEEIVSSDTFRVNL